MKDERTIAVYHMCVRCRFWEWNANYLPKKQDDLVREPPDKKYKCKVNPPAVDAVGASVWPSTAYTDYCGKGFEYDNRLYGDKGSS